MCVPHLSGPILVNVAIVHGDLLAGHQVLGQVQPHHLAEPGHRSVRYLGVAAGTRYLENMVRYYYNWGPFFNYLKIT